MSPFILPLVNALHAAGHQTYVVTPDRPLSWIGKAHAVGKTLVVDKVCPYAYTKDRPCPCAEDPASCAEHSWFVLDGSPASCTQIGLFHLDWRADDIDLVLSGPNHGRNASTIYNLSSGTVGGALEGAICGKKSISLSFGSKEPQPADIIKNACRRAVQIAESLYARWNPAVELYNINVPMTASADTCPAVFTIPSRSYWSKASLFEEDRHLANGPPHSNGTSSLGKRYFKWTPELSDIRKAAKTSKDGEDLWASLHGQIS